MPMSTPTPLLSYDLALEQVIARAQARRDQRRHARHEAPLSTALGKILADSLRSQVAVPAFDNAQMDGYAVQAESTFAARPEQPLSLPIRGAWAAGDVPRDIASEGAYQVTTGAMMPGAPYNAVVKVEDIELLEEGRTLCLRQPLAVGENVRYRGGDFQEGQQLATAGRLVSPTLIMACAGLGIDRLSVHEPVRIAVLATGKELQHYSDAQLRRGAIRDASGPYLDAVLARPCYELIMHKLIPDEPEMFASELNLCLEQQPDIIISTGAVSMGPYDFIPQVLATTRATTVFHKVAIRPGKPLLFAEWEGGPVLFGLPGNPVSTLIGWRFFVEPYLRQLLGRAPEQARRARLQHDVAAPRGMTAFYKARVHSEDAEMQVEILDGQGSHLISPLLVANAWCCLPAHRAAFEAGDLVPYYSLHGDEES